MFGIVHEVLKKPMALEFIGLGGKLDTIIKLNLHTIKLPSN